MSFPSNVYLIRKILLLTYYLLLSLQEFLDTLLNAIPKVFDDALLESIHVVPETQPQFPSERVPKEEHACPPLSAARGEAVQLEGGECGVLVRSIEVAQKGEPNEGGRWSWVLQGDRRRERRRGSRIQWGCGWRRRRR